MTLGSALGLAALGALPAIVAIHFFQRRARRVRIATLFLWERVAPESASGRVFERLRGSLTMWLQLAAACLLAWLLIDPQWVSEESHQTVVVVMDSSASMSAFRERAVAKWGELVAEASAAAGATRWIVLESDPRRPVLFRGEEGPLAVQALERWNPVLGPHSVRPVLESALAQVRKEGLIYFITDHEPDEALPDGVAAIGVGSALDNAGFAGATFEREASGAWRWKAFYRNHSDGPVERRWSLRWPGGEKEMGTLQCEARGSQRVAGSFPPGVDALELLAESDRFSLDDRVPVVRPEEVPLIVAYRGSEAMAPLAERLVKLAEPAIEGREDRADVLVWERALGGTLPVGNVPAIVWGGRGGTNEGASTLQGGVVAENDALVEGLSWEGLLHGGGGGWAPDPADRTLVWQGEQSLVFVRTGPAPALVFAFDVRRSNATRLPAFAVTMHRFLEQRRTEKRVPVRRNFDVRQHLDIAWPAGRLELWTEQGGGQAWAAGEQTVARAPDVPGFFQVRCDGTNWLRGAAQFADVREADLTRATTFDRSGPMREAVWSRQRQGDPWWPVWVGMVGGLLVGTWWCERAGRRESVTAAMGPRTGETA